MFVGFLGPLQLVHGSCSDALITDKPPILGLDVVTSVYSPVCLGGFNVPIFQEETYLSIKNNLTLPRHPSNSIGRLVCLAGDQKVDKPDLQL